MNFGLRTSDLDYIASTLSNFKEIDKAMIFGSRAKGNYKKGSDIDIAISGNNINIDTLAKLNSLFEEEGPLPYLIFTPFKI